MSKRNQQKEAMIAQIKKNFLALVTEKTYDDISMPEIAASAGISRATLYRYFSDKDALLMVCFWEIAELVKENVAFPAEFDNMPTGQTVYQNLLFFYRHIAENQPLYRAILCSSVARITHPQFRRLLVGNIMTTMHQSGTIAALATPAYVVINLIAEMQIGALIWWLENEQEVSPELLAELVVRLIETGLFGLTGQEIVESDVSATQFDLARFINMTV